MTTVAGAVSGALIGLGVFCAVAAFRPRGEAATATATRTPLTVRVDRVGLRTLLGVVGGAVGGLPGWPATVALGLVGGFCAPSLVGRAAAREQVLARTEALASWTESLRDLISAGSAIEATIAESARVAPRAIRPQVHALTDGLANNEPLDAALGQFAESLADPLADLVVTALLASATRQGGAKLSDVLAAAAHAARAQVAMRHQVEAARAGTYTSARVVVVVFAVFAVGLLVLNRSFLDPFGTPLGQLVLVAIGGLFGLCALSMARLAEPEVAERFYAAHDTGGGGW